MNNTSSEITYIPYQQHDEPARRAALTKVEFSLKGFSDKDIQVLGHLSEAVNLMNPIYRDQFEPKMPSVKRAVASLIQVANPAQQISLKNYLTILTLQNSPFALLPRKNHLAGLTKDDLRSLVQKAGNASLKADYEIVEPFLLDSLALSDKAGFYPPDMTEEEWKALGDDANIVNASFSRDSGKVTKQLNEEKYRVALQPVIKHLRAAREHTSHPEFRVYLDSKIEELSFGTSESRRIADYMWIRHGSPIDVVLSTALEVYLDNWKNARGSAAGVVMVDDPAAKTLLHSFTEYLPTLERTAPWRHRKMEIDPAKLPHLRFVDVLNWSGDYVNSPMTIIAQSLPNDEWVTSQIGSVNMVYRNTGKAIFSLSGNLQAEEFLPRKVFEDFREEMFEATQIHSALHELGHTTGMMDPDHQGKQARDYLEAEYSPLEEARAELFGMFAMPRLAKQGIISEKTATAGHYGMVISMINGLKFIPEQAHVKARNIMWHYLTSNGGIEEVTEDGKKKFQINLQHIDRIVEQLLGDIGNIKSAGAKDKAVALREKYCFTDPMRPDVEKRTTDFPLGRGLIFPTIKRDGDHYTSELEYPANFTDQPKFNVELLK
jgi:hypothetical protein